MKERVVSLCRLGASELTRERLFVVQSATGGLGLLNVDAEFAWGEVLRQHLPVCCFAC